MFNVSMGLVRLLDNPFLPFPPFTVRYSCLSIADVQESYKTHGHKKKAQYSQTLQACGLPPKHPCITMDH